MNSKQRQIVLFALLGVLVLAINAIIFLQAFYGQSEMPGKIEWSVIQATEERWRTNDRDHVLFHSVDSRRLVGVRAKAGIKRVWILLNPLVGTAVKKMADDDYSISQEELGRIRAFCDVNPAVLQELISHSEPEKP